MCHSTATGSLERRAHCSWQTNENKEELEYNNHGYTDEKEEKSKRESERKKYAIATVCANGDLT